MPSVGIEPFYFGPASKPLFGCYQRPLAPTPRNCGVLLCYPLGPEYIRSHRSYRQLSARLGQAGFGVLRFDYYGCGDSGGDFENCQLSDWRESLLLAVKELKRRCPQQQVCVVGLRLGATLSMSAVAGNGAIDALVLWDPVLDGQAYLHDLTTWHADTLARGAIPKRPAHELDATHTEILGYPFSHALMEDIARVDPLAIRQAPAKHILVIEADSTAGTPRFREHLEQLGADADHLRIDGPQVWQEEPYQAVIPLQVLQAIVGWISKVCA